MSYEGFDCMDGCELLDGGALKPIHVRGCLLFTSTDYPGTVPLYNGRLRSTHGACKCCMTVGCQCRNDIGFVEKRSRPKVDETSFEVELILRFQYVTRQKKKQAQFEVKWRGYSKTTMQTEDDLTGAPIMLKAFLMGEPALRDRIPSDGTDEVEALVRTRRFRYRKEYLVRWKGYAIETWETDYHLINTFNVRAMVQDFDLQQKILNQAKKKSTPNKRKSKMSKKLAKKQPAKKRAKKTSIRKPAKKRSSTAGYLQSNQPAHRSCMHY